MIKKNNIVKKVIAIIIIAALSFTVNFQTMAASVNDIKNDIQQNKDQQNNIKSDINGIKNQQNQTNSELEAELKKYNDLQDQATKYDDQIKGYQDELDKAQKDYKDKEEMLKKRLTYIYEQDGNPYLNAILNSTSLSDMLDKAYMMSLMVKDTKELMQDVKSLREDIAYKKTLVEGSKNDIVDKVNDQQISIDKLKEVNQSLQSKINENQAAYNKLQDEQDNLQEELVKELTKLQSKSQSYIGGKMTWPVPASHYISSPFGDRSGRGSGHKGMDIAAPTGTTIVAAAGGTIINASWRSGYGNLVVIDHGSGISTYYGHCSKLLVQVGQKVTAGDVIAKVGSTGDSTGPHCHFEVRESGTPVNPMKYLQ